MWKKLSLRTRLFLPLGATLVAALVLGGISLYTFATPQLIEENEPEMRSARLVADALNSALRSSSDPQRTLDAFGQALGTSEAIRFRPAGTGLSRHSAIERCPAGSSISSPSRKSRFRFRS